jgi:hypothetical protein
LKLCPTLRGTGQVALGFELLSLKRKLSLPVSMIWQWWARRSSRAVVILASPNTAAHSLKLRLAVMRRSFARRAWRASGRAARRLTGPTAGIREDTYNTALATIIDAHHRLPIASGRWHHFKFRWAVPARSRSPWHWARAAPFRVDSSKIFNMIRRTNTRVP